MTIRSGKMMIGGIGLHEQLLIAVLILLLVFCLLAGGALALPAARRWIGRRTIGAFSDAASWRGAMERKAAALLHHMPVFPEEDMPAFFFTLERNGVDHEKMLRRRAAKLLLAAGLYADRNPALFDAGREYIASLLTQNGEWKIPLEHTDDALLAYAVLSFPGTDLYLVRPAMEQTARLLQSLAGEGDTIPSDSRNPDIRLAQTVGDVCPFLSAYAAAYGEPFYLNLAMRQINEYLLNGMHPVQGLPAQGFDRNSGLPIGAFGWSGACAAVAFGMMETYRHLPREDARRVKLSIHSRLFADRLCVLWGNDGSFPRLPSSSLLDTEASAVLAVFLWDAYHKTQDEKYLNCIRRTMENLRMHTRKNGLVDFAQPESLRPGFYWDTEVPTAGALAAALFAVAKIEGEKEGPIRMNGGPLEESMK